MNKIIDHPPSFIWLR